MTKKKTAIVLAFILIMLCIGSIIFVVVNNTTGSPVSATIEINPDSWVAVDDLGRTVSTYEEIEDTKEDKKEKYVGIFYWTWHYQQAGTKAYNLTQIIHQYPEASNDWEHAAWSNTASGTYYFWEEPLFGYYVNTDEYVIRKHAELFADAGIDVVIFDCTNGTNMWPLGYRTVFEIFAQAREDGVDTPQIAFMLNFAGKYDTKVQLKMIYREIYEKEKYKDLWFMWEGKPLIMADSKCLDLTDEKEAVVAEFFTFRKNDPSYFSEDTTIDQETWGWCSVFPQTKYGVREDGSVEQMTISVAQNANEYGLVAMNDPRGGVYGRAYAEDGYSYTYTYQNEEITVDKDTENAYYYGLNFQQQWDYAFEADPDFIFITGWNEWIVGRQERWQDIENAFPDQFTDEYSRDIEPTKGVLKDNYYYQLVSNIRKFKGADGQEAATGKNHVKKTIDINSDTDQWEDVLYGFAHYSGSTMERDSKGWGSLKYESNTMRNDIILSKVAYDDEYVYFMVETVDDITDASDPAWMRLLIDTDFTDTSQNWEGFEYIVNRVAPDGTEAVIERSVGDWNFTRCGTASFSVKGNRLQIAVPRSVLEMPEGGNVPSFNFKWADNTRVDDSPDDSGDILDFYQYGDVAPGGRFMFAFRVEEDGPKWIW